MTLDLARLIIDAGFVVLIWAVQLVIYPSFGYYSRTDLHFWHKSYTTRVTFIVLPLMISQLILGIVQLCQSQNWYTITSIIIIASLWFITFLVFVPLHRTIDANKPIENVCSILVLKNWIRTILWTLLFTITLINFLYF